MTPERWQQIKRVLVLVEDSPADSRSTVLGAACEDDADLRREVESLLAYQSRAEALEGASPAVRSGIERVGAQVSHYRVLGVLGGGGMGLVYRAEDLRLGRHVALKFLPHAMAADTLALQRFEREARAAASLSHSNICTIHEVEEHEGQPFIVMELLEGQTLREILAAPLEIGRMLDFGAQIAAGLEAAHRRGIIHRDIKPANIFVTRLGQAKILDFGLAKVHDAPFDVDDAERDLPRAIRDPCLSTTGVAMGTVGYMSPEQVRGEKLDLRSDLFSFGLVLYEMATGVAAFADKSGVLVQQAIVSLNPSPTLRLRPDLPSKLVAIIEKALRKEPGERYRSAAEMAADLEAVRDEIAARRSRSKRARWRPIVAAGVSLAAILAIAGLTVGRLRERPNLRPRAPHISSLAVMPFRNLTGDPAQEYLADGMTEELTTDLAQIAALKVIAPSSAMRYKDTKQTPAATARELNVDGIVEGSVQLSDNRIKVTAELIYPANGTNLWADSYERDMHDVLTLQEEISHDIAAGIRVGLTPQELTRLNRTRAVDPAAYEDYLKGMYYWNKLSIGGYNEGIKYFQQAIAKDPTYAEAYVGLANCYIDLGIWGGLKARESASLAKAAIAKALGINERMSSAHGTLGHIHFAYDWDWAGAEREFHKALELDSNDVYSHVYYSIYLSSMGRYDESVAEIKKAHERDPVSHINNMIMGCIYYWGHHFEESVTQNKRTLVLYPDSVVSADQLGLSYEKLGKDQEAMDAYLFQERLMGTSPERMRKLRQAFVTSGLKGYWKARMLKESSGRSIDPGTMAVFFARMGENERALEWILKAKDARSHGIAFMKAEPSFDGLHSDPRFQDLLSQLGLQN